MKNSIIYIFFMICTACSLQKQVIKKHKGCSDNDNIFGEKLYKLDTTNVKNISYEDKIFFENDTIKKSIALYNNSTIALYIENKIHSRCKLLYYKNLKLSKELEVFKFKYKDSYNIIFINKNKYYDESGKLIKTVDIRQKEKYPICYKEAYAIVGKWKPKRYEINHMERDSIVNKKGVIYTWNVHITPENYKGKSYLYTINAKNGKKIKKVQTQIVPSSL